MLTITDRESLSRALSSPIDARLKLLLMDRRDQLGGDFTDKARFLIPSPRDSLEGLEKELGFPGLSDPESSFGCEWVADLGALYEAVWILSDDGFAHVALISKEQGIDPRLIELCAALVKEQV